MAQIILPIDLGTLPDDIAELKAMLQAVITMMGAQATGLSDQSTEIRRIVTDILDPIRAEVAAIDGEVPSVVALLKQLSDQLVASAADPAAVAAIADKLRSDADAFAAAVTQFTPPAPAPAP